MQKLSFERRKDEVPIWHLKIPAHEKLKAMGLNERQIRAIKYVKKEGKITNSKYKEICNVSERTATRDLNAMVHLGVLTQIGRTGKGTNYTLRRHNDVIDATKAP